MWKMEGYEVITKIGKGASGSVFLTRSSKLKKLVAIKQIEIDEARRSRSLKAVVREAKFLRTLNHFHIVKCFEWFHDDQGGILSMVLEYCDGGTVQDKIKTAQLNHYSFPEEKVLMWTTQITSAVSYIHERRILHRDLKSENVFLLKTGDVKLGDFGISKEIDHTLDKASTCVGTPCYLSPELCQDIPYSFKSDIWALGCLVFEMLALKPAFDAANLVSLFHKIVNCKFSALPSTCSGHAKEFVSKTLTRVPEERPTASELLNLPMLRKYSQCIRVRSPELTQQLPQKASPPKLSLDVNEEDELDDLDELLQSSGDVFPHNCGEGDSKRSISVHGEYFKASSNKNTEEPDELDNERPQSCPHSAVSRNFVMSTCDTVATWSGYGDRGSCRTGRRRSGNHSNFGSDPNKNLFARDSESDSDLDPIPTQRDYSSDDFSSSTDEDSIKPNITAGDDEIPEVIEGSDEDASPKYEVTGVTENVTAPRNLPGSAWLKSKRVQVLRRKQDQVRHSLVMNTIPNAVAKQTSKSLDLNSSRYSSVTGPAMDSKTGKQAHEEQRNRRHNLPGSSWLKRESGSSADDTILGNASSKVDTGGKKKRKLPGSGWLLGKEKQETLLLGDSLGAKKASMKSNAALENSMSMSPSPDKYRAGGTSPYDDDYPDDFEEDSDTSDCNDFEVTETVTPHVSSLELVKQDCIDSIGIATYQQLLNLFHQGLTIGEVYERCKRKVDFETLETCYLLMD